MALLPTAKLPTTERSFTQSTGGGHTRVVPLGPDLLLLTISAPLVVEQRLTRAEHEVARLAAEGLSNAAIAARRTSSRHTVANLLAVVYRKLGISGRRELRTRFRARG